MADNIIEADISEKKPELCSAIRGKGVKDWNLSAIQRLWNDVTASTFQKVSAPYDINKAQDNDILPFKNAGTRIIILFDELLEIMINCSKDSLSRKLRIYRKYIQNDSITLAHSAPEYEVSRERIRQLVKNITNNIFRQFCKFMMLDNVDFNTRIEQLSALLQNIDHDVISLTAFGLTDVSKRKKKAIFNMLFGNAFSLQIIERSNEISNVLEKQNMLCQKYEMLRLEWVLSTKNMLSVAICSRRFAADRII